MNNKSYQQIYDMFEEMFPEFKPSIKEWGKVEFSNDTRMVEIKLKNGCSIYFGTMKDEDSEWTWIANLDMSEKTKAKLGVTVEE